MPLNMICLLTPKCAVQSVICIHVWDNTVDFFTGIRPLTTTRQDNFSLAPPPFCPDCSRIMASGFMPLTNGSKQGFGLLAMPLPCPADTTGFFSENTSLKADYVFPIAYPDLNLPTVFAATLEGWVFWRLFYGQGQPARC